MSPGPQLPLPPVQMQSQRDDCHCPVPRTGSTWLAPCFSPSSWRQHLCQPETRGRRDLAKGHDAPALPVPCVVDQTSWHWGKRLMFQSPTRFIEVIQLFKQKPPRTKTLAFSAAPFSESPRVLHHGRQGALHFGVHLSHGQIWRRAFGCLLAPPPVDQLHNLGVDPLLGGLEDCAPPG